MRAVLVLALVLATSLTPAVIVHAQKQYMNSLVSLLDEDKVAFGLTVNSRVDPVTISANSNIDFVFYDMEHQPFDVAELRNWMQWLLDPGAIAKAGDVKAAKTVIVRIPAYGRELESNTWMVKQVLDAGVHGIIFPTIETPEQAFTAIRAMRYPQKPGTSNFEPDGIRGTAPNMAARYWGLSVPDYIERADIWRRGAPNGNLIPWFLIENKLGVANVREIARQLKAKNIGAVLFAGSETGGDMVVSHGGDVQAVAKAIDTILAAGKEFGLPVAMVGTTNVKQRVAQGARLFTGGATPAIRKEVGR
jgi:4-hydroxy-2-oxoheptanedioate aldolase